MQGSLVTDLNRAWLPESVAPAVETLLGRRPGPDLTVGRIPLLVCGECGDLACGTVTAALDVGATEVTCPGSTASSGSSVIAGLSWASDSAPRRPHLGTGWHGLHRSAGADTRKARSVDRALRGGTGSYLWVLPSSGFGKRIRLRGENLGLGGVFAESGLPHAERRS